MMCYSRVIATHCQLLEQLPCMQMLCLMCHTSAGWQQRADGLVCRIFAGEGDLGVKFF